MSKEHQPSLYASAPALAGEPLLRPRTYLYIVAAWTFVALFNTEQTYASLAASGRALAWFQVFKLVLPGMVLWALLTPLIMRLVIRYPLEWKTLPVHLLAAAVACALDASLYHLVDPWVSISGTRTWVAGFLRYMQINTINYFGVVAVTLVSRYATLLRERMVAAAELESQLTTAHLRSLQAQLRPHFLFNTLNTIAELVHRDPEAADKMISRLGALLRRSFDTFGDEEVSLGSELEFLRDYSEIVCARFRGRISITMIIDPDAIGARVPSLILQPSWKTRCAMVSSRRSKAELWRSSRAAVWMCSSSRYETTDVAFRERTRPEFPHGAKASDCAIPVIVSSTCTGATIASPCGRV